MPADRSAARNSDFAPPQRLLGALLLRHVPGNADAANRLAVSVEVNTTRAA